MTIDVIQSQKPEILLDYVMLDLAQLNGSAAAVFQKTYFIIPSHGIGQWLKQKIAERQGISANLQFEALRTFQWSLYQQILGAEKIAKAPQMLNMKWKIFLFLSQFEHQKLEAHHPLSGMFAKVAQHCQHFNDPVEKARKHKHMLYWVADQTSRLFANYMIYRGECVQGCMAQCVCRQNWLSFWGQNKALNIEKWIRNPEKEILASQPEMKDHAIAQAQQLEEWQRFIWYAQFAEDFAEMQNIDREFWQTIEGAEGILFQAKLPKQIYVFTLLELPPAQLYFLRRLAQYTSVKVYHYSASQEYWADSVDPKWKAKYALKYPMIADAYESRHPLLTRLGKQARDISALLTQLSGGEEGLWQDEFAEELPNNLLESLQSDILYLHEPQADSYHLDPHDRSVQIHVCHSSLRQLEVLKDQLLQWLSEAQDVPRQPSDIVVLVPNLQDIEPLIRTVFTANPDHRFGNLPVKIAGVPLLDAMQLWQAIMLRMKLLQQRFTLEQFVDWLTLVPIQHYYTLNFEQIQRITELLKEAGFKRGFDAVHLAKSLHQQDTDYKFTFRYALDRLALAIAMPEHAVFNGVLSLEHVRYSDFELIATLIQIYEDLDERREWLYADYLVAEQWDDTTRFTVSKNKPKEDYGIIDLLGVLDVEIQHFVSSTGFEQIETAIRKLKRIIDMTDAESAQLSLNYLLEEIANSIEHQVGQTEPTGQITFAQMGQLRPLPYRLVVCLNMDTGTFPNRDSKIPFDLMELLRQELGDRSRFEDDQGSFLDAILLAQESFWLFYNGFDVNDAEVRDPSSIVQELIHHLDFLVATHGVEQPILDVDGVQLPAQLRQLFYVHALQPYDPNDFIKPDIQRFKNQWFHVANHIIQPTKEMFHWLKVEEELPQLTIETPTVLTASHWMKDLISPAQHFLKAKGVAQVNLVGEHESYEPLQLDGLQKYHVRDYLKQYLTDDTPPEQVDLALLQDKLPVGKMVNATWEVAKAEQQMTKQRLIHHGGVLTTTTQRDWQYSPQFHFKLTVPEHRDTTKWVSLTSSSAYADKPLMIWLEYLLWRASTDHDIALERIAIYKNKTLKISELTQAEAKGLLAHWLEVWQLAQAQPFVLPPKLFVDMIGTKYEKMWDIDDQGTIYCVEEKRLAIEKQWLGQKYYSSGFEDAYTDLACHKHPLWSLTVLEDQALDLLQQHIEQYAAKLYAPLIQKVSIVNEDAV